MPKAPQRNADLARQALSTDPRDAPAYGMAETARLLGIPLATLRSWVRGRHYPTGRGRKWFPPLIELASDNPPLLSFCNLVEAHVLGAFRREHHVPVPAIRRALDFVAERYRTRHPLVDREFETDGAALFLLELGKLIEVSASGQLAIRDLLERRLRRVERDRSGVAIRLYPFTRREDADPPRSVVIDPHISFGRPVIRGTRIPTSVIAERYKAGDSTDELMHDYGRSRQEIEEALRCELQLEAA